jgi:NADPH2:quinone reductase
MLSRRECLVHAAAGGTGQLLSQVAKIRGAAVIGTVSSDAKAAIAKGRGGCDHVVDYSDGQFAEEVRFMIDELAEMVLTSAPCIACFTLS